MDPAWQFGCWFPQWSRCFQGVRANQHDMALMEVLALEIWLSWQQTAQYYLETLRGKTLNTFFLAFFLIWHTSHCALVLELSWESAEQTSDFSAHLFFSFIPFHCSFPLCKDQYHTDHYRDSTIALPCERATNTCIHSIDRVFVWVCVCLCLNSAAELMLYDSTAAFPLSKGKRQRGKMPEEKSKSFIDLESEKEVRWAL